MAERPRYARAAVATVVLLAVALHSTTDNAVVANVCYLGVLVGAGAGAWIGALRAPRGRRLVPSLVAVGLCLTALGDVLWSTLDLLGADTDVSVADPAWFVSYVVLCVALWIVLRRTRRGTDRVNVDFVVDAASIVVVSLLCFWSLSIDAIIDGSTLTTLETGVLAAYPVADAFLLALVLRVLASGRARATIGGSFAVGVCLWLAADVTYLHSSGDGVLQSATDAAWMVGPVLMARAAWRVDDGRTASSTSTSRADGWVVQIFVAVGPLMVPPALELIADLRGEPDQPIQLMAGTAALVALALVRTAGLIRSEEHARRELEVARDAALEASRVKSMFLANVSHEIRTPLTTVLATAELLEDTPLSQPQTMLLAKMQRSGQMLQSLVEEVLDFSRIEAGQLKLDPTAYDLTAMVTDVALVFVPRAGRAGIGFEWHLDPRVPRTVVGDSGRLFQVLTNLLDNALKFTHQGQVTLTVRPAEDGADRHEMVELVVSDTGIGISEDDQRSVFESFKQVDGSATRHYSGTGLGLAICKELTMLMGGTLTLRSRLGAGTTFIVRVPLPEPVLVAAPEAIDPPDPLGLPARLEVATTTRPLSVAPSR
jgi:signal transduction histidine kinase